MDQNLMSILSLMYPQVGAVLPVLSKLTGANANGNPSARPLPSGAASADGRIIYVQGETEASMYRVNAGEKIALFDSESDVVYIKYAEDDGKQHMATADLFFRKPENPDDKFVRKADFEAFQKKLFETLGGMTPANPEA